MKKIEWEFWNLTLCKLFLVGLLVLVWSYMITASFIFNGFDSEFYIWGVGATSFLFIMIGGMMCILLNNSLKTTFLALLTLPILAISFVALFIYPINWLIILISLIIATEILYIKLIKQKKRVGKVTLKYVLGGKLKAFIMILTPVLATLGLIQWIRYELSDMIKSFINYLIEHQTEIITIVGILIFVVIWIYANKHIAEKINKNKPIKKRRKK